jgi:dCMP deaminase
MKTVDTKREKWDSRFLALARHVAEWSIDPTTKVGCVIVGPSNEVRALGYNGFPRNVDDAPGRLERPVKYTWIEHAERNAIYAAARVGVPIEGCRVYLSWFPCIDCARALVQVGITEIIAVEPDWSLEPWGPQFVQARTLLREGKVRVCLVNPTADATVCDAFQVSR